jgi:transcription elongation factor Elf1
MPLDAVQQRTALQRITVWRSDPKQSVICPACNREGLVIIDRSARPYAEWYALSCAACGLDETLHVALGPSVPTLD